MNFTEDSLERAIIEKLVAKGYTHASDSEWVISRTLDSFVNERLLLERLAVINNGVKLSILKEAVKKIKHIENTSLFEKNHIIHKMIVDGITIEDYYARVNPHIRFIDFDNVKNNTFEVVNQIRLTERDQTRKPDVIIYINGLPLVIFEIKSIDDRDDTALEQAYKQLGGNTESDGYRYDIPTLFAYNAFCIISDGAISKVGTLTSDLTRYSEWKSGNGEVGYEKNYAYKLDVLIDGLLEPKRLLEVIKGYLFFMQKDKKKPVKVLAQYHQFFGVRKAYDAIVKSIRPKGDGRAGLLWHTQGSGKSFSMVMLANKLITDTGLNNPTVVVLTDRNDLDSQLYLTFANAKEFLRTTPLQINSRKGLLENLSTIKSGGVVFSTIQKFDKDNIKPNERENIIVLSDEAHRSHYGIDEKVVVKKDAKGQLSTESKFGYAKYIRDALPNATFFGFTGTPVTDKDRSTSAIFGEVVDTYDMTQSIEDGSTVKLFYESRLAKVWLDEEKLKEVETYYNMLADESVDEEIIEESKKKMSRMEVVVGNEGRLKLMATDILSHYKERQNVLNGKAMIVCMSRKIAFGLYNQIIKADKSFKDKLAVIVTESNKDTDKERELFKDKTYRQTMAAEFKKADSKVKIVIVVDMWLTGFDVTDLDIMYIDKPMKSHNLMQAIARVNRVHQGKESGLIVDYIGVKNALKAALNDFTARDREFNLQDIQKVAKDVLLDKLSILDEMFFKVENEDFFTGAEGERFSAIQNGANFVLANDKRKKGYMAVTKQIKDVYVVAFGVMDETEKAKVNYYLAVRYFVRKLIANGGGKFNPASINLRVSEMITEAIKGDEVEVLTQLSDDGKTVWDFLSDENIKKLRESNPPHIFVKIIEKLLKQAIAEYRGYNLVKAKAYTERLKSVLEIYNNRENDQSVELTILGLVEFSSEMVQSEEYARKNSLSGRERAFYDALASEKSAGEIMGDEVLKIIAGELKAIVEQYGTVDWSRKENTRAEMRSQIRRLLKKYKYPPEFEQGAIDRVIKQAEYMM